MRFFPDMLNKCRGITASLISSTTPPSSLHFIKRRIIACGVSDRWFQQCGVCDRWYQQCGVYDRWFKHRTYSINLCSVAEQTGCKTALHYPGLSSSQTRNGSNFHERRNGETKVGRFLFPRTACYSSCLQTHTCWPRQGSLK